MSQLSHLTTGIEALDSVLGGGMPTGTLVTVSARAASQTEVVLQAIASAHPVEYITTERSEASPNRSLQHSTYNTTPGGSHDDERDAETTVTAVTADTPVSAVEHRVHDVGSNTGSTDSNGAGVSVVIIDVAGVLERAVTTSRYREFLNSLQSTVREHGCVAVLHCHDDAPGENREVTHTISDTVLTVSRATKRKPCSSTWTSRSTGTERRVRNG